MTAGDVMDRAAACLNDPNKATYTYTVQLPYLKMAYDHFEGKLVLNNIPILKEVSADIDYTANATTITKPSGLFLPVFLKERDAGSTDDDSWLNMTETSWDENRDAQEYLGVWTWREEALVVGKCSRNRDVQVRYIKDTTGAITDQSTTINITRAINCLAFKTAYFIAALLMNNPTRSGILAEEVAEAYDDWLTVGVKKNQSNVVRRKRYAIVGKRAIRPYIT